MRKKLKSEHKQGEMHEFENLNNDKVHTAEQKYLILQNFKISGQ